MKHCNLAQRHKLIVFLAVAVAMKFVMDILPNAFVETVFMRPATHLAALYWSTTPQIQPLSIFARGVTIEVTRACAATDFFAIVFALLAFALPIRRAALRIIAAIPSAWVVAIFANTARLALLIVTDGIFPAAHIPAVHLAAGIAVFLPFYAALWYFLFSNKGTAK